MHQARLPFEPDAPSHLPREAQPHLVPEGRPHLPGAAEPNLVFVRHPRARRYVIRVRLDGSVRVTIPRRGSKREAEAFVAAQHTWIERERARVAEERRAMPAPMPIEELRAWRRRAQAELPPRLLQLAAAFSLQVNRISIRNQRGRWGSCSPSGHITLNWRLVTMPDWVRDYVLIHELMHLKRMDHSPKFWKLVAAACPDYQAARAWLRANTTRQVSG